MLLLVIPARPASILNLDPVSLGSCVSFVLVVGAFPHRVFCYFEVSVRAVDVLEPSPSSGPVSCPVVVVLDFSLQGVLQSVCLHGVHVSYAVFPSFVAQQLMQLCSLKRYFQEFCCSFRDCSLLCGALS